MSSPRGLHSGWLKIRRQGFFGLWRSVYCELRGRDILFKRSEADGDAKCTIRILPTSDIHIVEQDRHFRFAVSDTQLQAADAGALMGWVSVLRTATFAPRSMDEFDVVKVIGRGSSGKVMLCASRATGDHFAIKSIRKSGLVSGRKVANVIRERVRSPFVVALKFAFQTPAKFYLGLEYAAGGDLSRRMCDATAADARLYIAEVALALECLHREGIVYRDLKPENVVIDCAGHVKLTDFGLAKRIGPDDAVSTFCGTPGYIAPEMIKRERCAAPVDWWALGVLAFELLFKRPPFAATNRVRLYQMILAREPDFPPGADSAHVDFVSRLLVKPPKLRATLATLRNHAFWEGMQFEDVESLAVKPTFVPACDGLVPAQNFDQRFTAENPCDSLATPEDACEFKGFSFTGVADNK
jgi:serine/threonine protein kinase